MLEGNPKLRRFIAQHMAHSEATQAAFYNDFAAERRAIGASVLINKLLTAQTVTNADLSIFGNQYFIVLSLII